MDEKHPFHLDAKEYGDKYNDHLIEQYKKYIDGIETLITRRQKTNDFFLAINTGIFGVAGFLGKFNDSYVAFAVLVIAFIGMFISFMWFRLILAYKSISAGKYKVLHKMEKRLPSSLYTLEWELLGHGKDGSVYTPITHVEMNIPLVFMVFYIILIFVSIKGFGF